LALLEGASAHGKAAGDPSQGKIRISQAYVIFTSTKRGNTNERLHKLRRMGMCGLVLLVSKMLRQRRIH